MLLIYCTTGIVINNIWVWGGRTPRVFWKVLHQKKNQCKDYKNNLKFGGLWIRLKCRQSHWSISVSKTGGVRHSDKQYGLNCTTLGAGKFWPRI